MTNGTQDKVHISVTMLIGAFLGLLTFIWQAQAQDVEEAAELVTENSKAIAVLINENAQRKEDANKVQKKVDENGKVISRIEITLTKIATKLEVQPEPTPP